MSDTKWINILREYCKRLLPYDPTKPKLMADKITHLILIESSDPIGMDEIIRRVAEALRGDVIELRRVILPNQPSPQPDPVITAPVAEDKPDGKRFRQKQNWRAWIRVAPSDSAGALGRMEKNSDVVYTAEEIQFGYVKLAGVGWVTLAALEEVL